MHIETLTRQFMESYPGRKPTAVVEAPGRVNLIGEHTDYNGYPVLPMALRKSVRIALVPRDDTHVTLRSSIDKFGERSFDISRDIEPSPPGDWCNYLKAAAQAIMQSETFSDHLRGFDALVIGDVPPGGGLSSSSALVVAAALALLAANSVDDTADRSALADLMAEAEHYVGTVGGGMDQTACLKAEEGAALRIDFFPLHTQSVPIPSGVRVIVANSLVVAEKSGAAMLMYNRRPLECRLGAKLLATRDGLDVETVQRLAQANPADDAWERFTEQPYSKAGIADELGVSSDELDARYLTLRDGDVFPEPEDGFRLRERLRHVLTESARVGRATDALAASSVDDFGRLMDESHASCRDDYGISTPELDRLVGIMKDAGALGARLTGAGFGGCAVALVRDADAERVMDAIRSNYYRDACGLTEPPSGYSNWDEVAFATDAGPGARVIRV
jgi:N-acetylgalactosamine kinase